ncbi:serine/threonine transporter SstT [Lacticaseibacillus mingshuiensis]|uniref:serine/threonine transporter SstT n=1 Tax=Lacticaseibacillus mingshuiensis TaxID=2799574 RepID=UPI0019436B94|nr:serine/threonine transporter SstT [Lacticaseibacillus mingshuiensis]
MFRRYRSISLILRILIGLVVGALLGVALPSWTFIGVLGDLFVGALKGIAPILVFFLITTAISRYKRGAENHFGTVIKLYLIATLVVAVAAVAASYFFPIKLIVSDAATKAATGTSAAPQSLGTVLEQLVVGAVSNPFGAMIEGNYLAILFWALMIGSALRLATETTRQTISDITDAIQHVAQLIIEFAPFGIVGLLFRSISENGLNGVARYGQLVLLLVGTMAFVYLVLYAGMVWLETRQNPYPLIFWTLKTSGIPAFFTRSGAVNIPINLQASEDLGLSKSSYAISIPLGGSANSGGAAITITIMTLAAAHTVGVPVSWPLAFLLCFLSALASTGVSGIAGGSLLLIPMAASLFGIHNDFAMQVVGIGFIIGVIQDSVETAVNSASDLLLTAAAEFGDARRDGKPIDVNARVRQARKLE